MASLRARLVDLALPLLGIRKFFSEPDKLDERIAKLRTKPSPRPKARLHQRFDIVEETSRGYPVVTMTPKSGAGEGAPHLLYLHGGAYVMDIDALHWELVADLCERLGASASVPVYPLAPEHKAAEVLPAMQALFRALSQDHGAANITIMGDSAGGGMALALAQLLKEAGDPLPGNLVLYSPWVDATAGAPGQREIERRDRMLAVSGLEACGRLYRGDLALDDPRISPLFGNLEGLPPIAIFSGTSDILLVDGRRLAERLSAPGMPEHRYFEYDDMFHVWMLLPVPEARRARDQTVEFIRRSRSTA